MRRRLPIYLLVDNMWHMNHRLPAFLFPSISIY
ncbi:hypothetical protein DK45_4532 [Bordetella bronchiseptica]|nr:hypothetical protein DK45_4532 [Bordetella bronchiseptica]